MTMLHIDNMSLQLAGNTRPTLTQINYVVQPGDFIILLGSNGSGKSTLLKLLHQQHHPTSGQIHFLGRPILQHSLSILSRHIAVLTQNCSDSLFTSLTIYENYLLAKQAKIATSKKERDSLKEYLSRFNLNLSDKLDLTIQQLSGGEKQALALALCLLQPPTLLLLDEHTSALDPKTSEQIMQLTQKMIALHNITCILTTHDLDIALRYGNRILILQEGRVMATFDHNDKARVSKDELINCYF